MIIKGLQLLAAFSIFAGGAVPVLSQADFALTPEFFQVPDHLLQQEELDAFVSKIKSCWIPPRHAEGHRKSVSLRLKFTTDGALASVPNVTSPIGKSEDVYLAATAIGAIAECSPYDMLPKEKYRQWKEVEIDLRY